MENLLIKSVRIDWSRIPADSYLNDIPALEQVEEIRLQSPVTFFAGENGTGEHVKIRLS